LPSLAAHNTTAWTVRGMETTVEIETGKLPWQSKNGKLGTANAPQ